VKKLEKNAAIPARNKISARMVVIEVSRQRSVNTILSGPAVELSS
jgi:hypothetical protein